jgi:endonuclease/exonuclease/phosphatase family metal-dependent hydrolase
MTGPAVPPSAANPPVQAYDPGYGPLVTTSVRIATWNLWGRYGPWEARGPAIEATLRDIAPDICALQEVWEDDARSQARGLMQALGFEHHVFAANLERDGARSGNAIVSRWPIIREVAHRLPRVAGGARDEEDEERLVVLAEVDGPRGPIQVYCAHLSWRSDHSAIRQAQVAEICTLVRANRPRTFPAVLCGDLNAEPHSEEIRMLTGLAAVPVPGVVFRDAWLLAGKHDDPGFTCDNTNPFIGPNLGHDMRIDYVMVAQPRLGGVGSVLDVRVAANAEVGGIWPSDHFAVVAEMRY